MNRVITTGIFLEELWFKEHQEIVALCDHYAKQDKKNIEMHEYLKDEIQKSWLKLDAIFDLQVHELKQREMLKGIVKNFKGLDKLGDEAQDRTLTNLLNSYFRDLKNFMETK